MLNQLSHTGAAGFLALMNNASMDICVQVFVYTYVLISLGYIPGGRTARSYDNFIFNLAWKCGGSKT